MGQDISRAITPPPLTLQDCIVDGRVDISRYLYFRRTSDHYQDIEYEASTQSKDKSRSDSKKETSRKKRQERNLGPHAL